MTSKILNSSLHSFNIRGLQISSQDFVVTSELKGKGKAVPLQAWSGPEGSRKLWFLDFMTTAQGCGKVVSLTYRPHLPPENPPGSHIC